MSVSDPLGIHGLEGKTNLEPTDIPFTISIVMNVIKELNEVT